VDKSELRAELAMLPGVAREENEAVVDHLFNLLSPRLPGTISSYRALGDEVSIDSLMERLPGWRWILPRVEDDGSLTWRDARLPLEVHRWGMEQPLESGPVIPTMEIDVFLVPGLAFDRSGSRLGRGGGFYDRELAAKRSDAVSIGVTVDSRLRESLPVEQHDIAVMYVVTESGVIEPIPTR
jgi:5-formyltetrahydrofolate cyclo-ligase